MPIATRPSSWPARLFSASPVRPDQNSASYLPGLDGWRALAVILVILDHCQPLPSFFHPLQSRGTLGVEIFFAISGLLICTRLLAEEARYGKISIGNFYIRRAFRILPASALYLGILTLLGAAAIIPFERSSWLASLFFYRNYYSYFCGVYATGWFTAHFWSLSVEEHFYFLLPSILLFFPRTRQWILAVLSVISLGWLYYYAANTSENILNVAYWSQRTEFRLACLLIPALFALALVNPRFKQKATRFLPAWLGLILMLACLSHNVLEFLASFSSFAVGLLWLTALKSTLFPLILISTILHPRSFLTRFLELSPLRFVGRISYSLYLWQTLFLTRDITFAAYPIHVLEHPAIGIACTFACAIASYYFVETPFIRLARNFLKKPAPHNRNPLQES